MNSTVKYWYSHKCSTWAPLLLVQQILPDRWKIDLVMQVHMSVLSFTRKSGFPAFPLLFIFQPSNMLYKIVVIRSSSVFIFFWGVGSHTAMTYINLISALFAVKQTNSVLFMILIAFHIRVFEFDYCMMTCLHFFDLLLRWIWSETGVMSV